jgi:hypothetical protein
MIFSTVSLIASFVALFVSATPLGQYNQCSFSAMPQYIQQGLQKSHCMDYSSMRCLSTMGGVWVPSSSDGCFGTCQPCSLNGGGGGGEIAWNNQCVQKDTIPQEELQSCKYLWQGCLAGQKQSGKKCPEGTFMTKSMCVPKQYLQCVDCSAPNYCEI